MRKVIPASRGTQRATADLSSDNGVNDGTASLLCGRDSTGLSIRPDTVAAALYW